MELKVYKMIDKDYCDDSFCVEPSDVYLKSDADEELAKLNRQVESLYELKKEKAYLLEHTTEVINSLERVIAEKDLKIKELEKTTRRKLNFCPMCGSDLTKKFTHNNSTAQ